MSSGPKSEMNRRTVKTGAVVRFIHVTDAKNRRHKVLDVLTKVPLLFTVFRELLHPFLFVLPLVTVEIFWT